MPARGVVRKGADNLLAAAWPWWSLKRSADPLRSPEPAALFMLFMATRAGVDRRMPALMRADDDEDDAEEGIVARVPIGMDPLRRPRSRWAIRAAARLPSCKLIPPPPWLLLLLLAAPRLWWLLLLAWWLLALIARSGVVWSSPGYEVAAKLSSSSLLRK